MAGADSLVGAEAVGGACLRGESRTLRRLRYDSIAFSRGLRKFSPAERFVGKLDIRGKSPWIIL